VSEATLTMKGDAEQEVVAKALRSYETMTLRALERCRGSRTGAVNEEAAGYLRDELARIAVLMQQIGLEPSGAYRDQVEAWLAEGASIT
jgi:ribosome assembly protein YihI (activator of Der GTPase)